MKNNYLLRILILLCQLFSFAQSDFDCATLNPIVENNEINICEPGGNVTLNAQMNAGNQIYWYDAANSDTPIVKTSNFDAGYVSSNQSYWVSEVHEDRFTVSQQGRKTYANETSASLANRGLGFTADEAFKIISVDVFSSGDGGEAIIQLLQNRDVLEEKNIEIPAGNSS